MFLPAFEYNSFYTTNVSYGSDNNGNILIQIRGFTKHYTTYIFKHSYDIKLPVNYKRHEGYLIDLEYLKNKIVNLNRGGDKDQLSCYLVFRRSQRFGTVFMICYSQTSNRNEYYALFGSLRNNRDENNLNEKLDLLMILDNEDILERLNEAKRQSKRIALVTSGNTGYDTLNLNDAELYYFDYVELKKVRTISKIFLDINSSLDENSLDNNGLYVAQGNVIEYYMGSLVYASDKFKYMELPSLIPYNFHNKPQLNEFPSLPLYNVPIVTTNVVVDMNELRDYVLGESSKRPYILPKILINYLFTLALPTYITDDTIRKRIKYLFYGTRRFNVYLDEKRRESRGILLPHPKLEQIARVYDELLGLRDYSEIINNYINFISSYYNVNEGVLDKIRDILLSKETDNPLFNQIAFVAAFLGAHGLSHLIMKYLQATLRYKGVETGEFIDITVYKEDIVPLGFTEHTLYDSFIRVIRSKEDKYEGKIYISIKNYIRTPTIIDGSALKKGLIDYINKLLYLNGTEDRCNWTWNEERKRLSLSHKEVMKVSTTLESFDKYIQTKINKTSKTATYIYPPRIVFRLGTLKYFMREEIKDSETKKTFAKWSQFIWPIYIPSCSDGCQICTEIDKGCQMWDLNMSLNVSKEFAKYLLHKLNVLKAIQR